MSQIQPAFFESDRQPRWRAALGGVANWLRVRARQQPGYVLAAVTGSLGLILAVILLLGGWSRPQVTTPEDDAASLAAHLGEEEPEPSTPAARRSPSIQRASANGTRSLGFGGAVGDIPDGDTDEAAFDRNGDRTDRHLVSSSRAPRDLNDEPDDLEASRPADDEIDDSPAAEAEPDDPPVAGRLQLSRVEQPAAAETTDDDGTETDERGSFLGEDEPIIADEPAEEAMRDAVTASDADDESADVEPAAEEEDSIRPAPIRKAPPVTAIAPDADEPPESDDPFAEPLSRVPPQRQPGWKNSKGGLPAPAAAPDDAIEQSQPSETAVHAAHEEPRQPLQRPATRAEPAPARGDVSLAIESPRGPSSASGLTIDLVVRNMSRETLRGALLSVELPEGWSHPKGPAIEQRIDSLAPGGIHRARLRVSVAKGPESPPGASQLRAEVTRDGDTLARAASSLSLGAGSTIRSAASLPACETLPVTPIAPRAARK